MARTQVYGGREADEFRNATEATLDHYADNHIVEGRHVATLRRMATERDWKGIERYTAKLKAEGHSKTRIDSMITRSTAGLRF